MRGFVLLVALLFLPVVHAQVYPPCNYDSDCESGYYCINNQCREPCQSDDDCDSPATCQPDGYCGANFIECGNGVIAPPEECDDGNNEGGDGCSANCMKEKDVMSALFDIYNVHNLFFSKTLDLAHISKDLVFQEEIKVLQRALLDAFVESNCRVVPVVFGMTAGSGPGSNPYGKLNEINALNRDSLFTVGSGVFVAQEELSNAINMENDAELLAQSGNFLLAAQEKCCVLAELAFPGIVTFNSVTGECEGIVEENGGVPGRQGGGSGGASAAVQCCRCVIDGVERWCRRDWKGECTIRDALADRCGEPEVQSPAPSAQSVLVISGGKEYLCYFDGVPAVMCKPEEEDNPCVCMLIVDIESLSAAPKAPESPSGAVECRVDADCPSGYACRNGRCVMKESAPVREESDYYKYIGVAVLLLVVLALAGYLFFIRPGKTKGRRFG